MHDFEQLRYVAEIRPALVTYTDANQPVIGSATGETRWCNYEQIDDSEIQFANGFSNRNRFKVTFRHYPEIRTSDVISLDSKTLNVQKIMHNRLEDWTVCECTEANGI